MRASKAQRRVRNTYALIRWRAKHRERYRTYQREWARRNRARKREAVSQ